MANHLLASSPVSPPRPPVHHQASGSQEPSLCLCPCCSFWENRKPAFVVVVVVTTQQLQPFDVFMVPGMACGYHLNGKGHWRRERNNIPPLLSLSPRSQSCLTHLEAHAFQSCRYPLWEGQEIWESVGFSSGTLSLRPRAWQNSATSK